MGKRPIKPVYRCQVCGRLANYGFNVSPRSAGNWYCAEHKPEGK